MSLLLDARPRLFRLGNLKPSWEDLQEMKPVEGPIGSQGGEWRKSPTGTTYLVKPAQSPHHAMNEVAAGHVYHEAGVPFPNTHFVTDPTGQYHIVSEKVPGLHQMSRNEWNTRPDTQGKAAKDFGTDALLSHWDVGGLDADNTLVDDNGRPHRIESGGAMSYRGMGDPKPTFSPTEPWTEPTTMRTSEQGRRLYGNMSDQDAAASLQRAGQIDLGNVANRWTHAGIPSDVQKPWLDTIKARQKQIPSIAKNLSQQSF